MQTFLPYPDFRRSATALDDKRLGKQRSETMIIWKTLTGVYAAEGKRGWPHHPATKMWSGCASALLQYGLVMSVEWSLRGFRDGGTLLWFAERMKGADAPTLPVWFGDAAFHQSHRSNLLRKMPERYRQYWPDERDDLPYVWPV